ncbi:sigma-E processing peptidase SpoIIGA [Metabacillus iocasae]|uniref:Stage II sporulation protein GA (Sporulation sigma-E factor processing peptidase) n=1 Tax=Priestia iocasae TaxID=2291674 RepID=A0ABS2QQR2_9BACI|nr:sigma-E processing peptidase SpoIIGA [Metabacillus iocasae]MBM7701781.1 stage II sporulation protein GA (sporulation sigma-E factor processing peptidase) [Metabacillus iocasae]
MESITLPVYLDVIWLLNFGLDAILLMLCGTILKRSFKWWRLGLGAFIGSLIVLLMFTPFSSIMLHPFVKILFSILMVLTTFGYKRLRFFLENALTFYFATFVVGGGLMGMHFLFEDQFLSFEGVVTSTTASFGDPVSWLFVVIGFPILAYFSKYRIDDLRMKNITFDQLVKVEITLNKEVISLIGLIDSGNQLVDPLTKTPVMIMTADSVKDILPASILEMSKNVQSFSHNQEIDNEWYSKIRFVPYRSVGHANQLLLAIKPDKVKVERQTDSIHIQKVLIGISHTQLSAENQYQCIVHPKVMVTGEVYSAS